MASNFYPETELLGEPTLDEMLAEPIVQLIMKSDGVKARDMRDEFARVEREFAGLSLVMQ